MLNSDQKCLGMMDELQAHHLRSQLLAKDYEVTLLVNKETCLKGCRRSVELWATDEVAAQVALLMKEQRQKLLRGLEFDPEVCNSVVDADSESSMCPACGYSFDSKSPECPECGLSFASLV